MTGSNGINYRETYFEYPDLTKIHGEPTSESLFKLRNELKANAQAVYSNLSDGAHGHLALVLSAHTYGLLTAVPFVRPVHPGTLAIPDQTTAAMTTVMKEEHHEQVRLFREVQGVEKALIQQIVRAVEPPYLIALRDRNSNSLMGTAHSILDHLQQVYGRISPQMLDTREQELKDLTYNPKNPIDTVFNAVDDLADFARLGNQPLTDRQVISKAYIIINKTRRFKSSINEWNRKPHADQTWENFKIHFRQAHQEFRETTDITIEESELETNQANFVQRVIAGLRAADAEEADGDPSANLIQEMANSATRAEASQQQLATQLQEVTQTLANLQARVQQQPPPFQPQPPMYQNNQPPPFQPQYVPQQYQQGYNPHYQHQGRGRQGYQGRGRGRHRGRGRSANRARNTSMYCWSHGACGHTSATCFYKQQGHQDSATFQNTQGGSTNNCPPPA
jgi:hypothetical protein